ncbi:thioesterase II family protein [Streptomyces sp. HPF1205]|uniref:thioesterase II family protein n=1 Tax=Streptomyces sp. HPF1205 TaxID=2873262 RepID=UPI001CEC93A2|nr:thioesterase domain-containing protein [Streptomyces sp. HPF1205]
MTPPAGTRPYPPAAAGYGTAGGWLTMLRPAGARPGGRMLVFPHAGAGPFALTGLAALVPPDVEVLGVTLPGREHRAAEPGTTCARLVDGVEGGLRALPPLPTAFFGCSVGALFALLVASRRPALCDHLVVASQTPGPQPRAALRATGERDLMRVLQDAGDTPSVILEDPDIRASLLARLEGDLRLGAEAEPEAGTARVAAPLTVLAGLADPLVPADRLSDWPRHTTAHCRVVALSGGHFAFLERDHGRMVRVVLDDVRAELLGARAAGTG